MPTNAKDEKLLTSDSLLAIGGSLLPSKAEVKKPLMEDYLDELEDLGVLYCLEEVTLCQDEDEKEENVERS